MFKRVLAIATLLCALPMLAHAATPWTLTTWAKSSGGTISSRNNAAQTAINRRVFQTYTTADGRNVPVTVSPASGFRISQLEVNGLSTGAFDTAQTIIPTAGVAQSVFATFARIKYSLTATAGAGGTVFPAKRTALVGAQRPVKTFVFRPLFRNGVDAITGTYLINTTFAYKNARTGAAITLPAPRGVPVKVVITNVTGNATLEGVFARESTSAGPNQTALTGTTVILDGSLSTGAGAYAWTQVSGPVATLAGASTARATFTPFTAGTYVFQLTHGATSATTAVTVTEDVTQAVRDQCVNCHATFGVGAGFIPGGVYSLWLGSVHRDSNVVCYNCHVGANAGLHPGIPQCSSCHTSFNMIPSKLVAVCADCHGSSDPHAVVFATAPPGPSCQLCHDPGAHANPAETSCIACHALAIQHIGNVVNDNNGVRAILPEFSKRSHHILNAGSAIPTNAQCAVCHLEGKAVGGVITIDTTYHMRDTKIYLRDVDNADGVFVWNGADHTAMDNFCFACHDANGASDLTTLQGLIPAATAYNPFADTLTNGYDQVTRSGVVDVKTAFTTTNASHHAVSGQRYVYRFSTLANAQAWAARTGKPVPSSSQIAEFNPGATSPLGGTIDAFDTSDPYLPNGPEKGGEATLYEADKFVATYIPLGASQNVGDNSTLHCGDCHTVGQWKPLSSTNADGSPTSVAIGAHGSANSYLLRNSLGTDAIHNNLTYVCFNCHATSLRVANDALWAELVAEGLISSTVAIPTWKAGWNSLSFHPNVLAGQISGYATAHAVSAFHAQCQADSADNIASNPPIGFENVSSVRLQRSWRPQNVKIYDYVPFPGATATAPVGGSNASSGNITGISCTNCHNSALRSAFGGIHGGNNTYTDGLGRTQKSYRFMPGMGNYRYAPPGGWDGKDVSDPSLVTQATSGVGAGKPMGGCYTNGGVGGPNQDRNSSGGVTYGVCNHHGTSTAQTTAGGQAAGFRKTYGGGTTATPTAVEPTVREATAGGTLVTRPLKY